jgi:hypothetical protein
MGLSCPNKNSELYKLLKKLNNGSEGLATQYYDIMHKLQDGGLISLKRFKTENGEMFYSIPKIMTEKSIASNMLGGKAFQKNKAAFDALDKELTLQDIDWIKITETQDAYRVQVLPGVQTKMFNSVSRNEESGKYKDPLIKDKYFPDSNETRVMDILNKIGASKHILAKLATKLLTFSKYNNAKVILDDVSSYNMENGHIVSYNTESKANAYYDRATNTIHVAKNANFRKSVETVILHEILHSITHSKLRDSSTVSKDFQRLYDYAISKLNKKDFYGLTNVDEFIVALFTDARLINQLKNIEASKNMSKYKNLFEEIFDYILSLVNIGRTNSLYEQALSVASNVIEDQKQGAEAVYDAMEAETFASEEDKSEEKKKDKSEPAFKKQYVFFVRRINTLKKNLFKVAPGTDQYTILETELNNLIERFNKANEDQDRDEYVAMAKEHLDWVENFVKNFPDEIDEYTMKNIVSAFDILNTFEDFGGTAEINITDRIRSLRKDIYPHIVKHNLNTANLYNTSKTPITEKSIDKNNKDIRWSAKGFGSLLDSVNQLVKTIGYVIKNAQNKASVKNKQLEGVVQGEVDKLSDWGKKNGMKLQEVYDLFIQENAFGTLELTRKYTKNGKINPAFDKINKTPELLRFYNFYQEVLANAEYNLPYKVGKFYMINKVKSDVVSDLKRIIPTENFLFDSYISNEELLADAVPVMFRQKIDADKKSRDLGSGLLEFAAYANNHAELSAALPETRLLQEQIKYVRKENGEIVPREFVSSNGKEKIFGENSNAFKMTQTVIDMQLKGEMKKDLMKPIPIKWLKIYDKDGNHIGYKQVRIEALIDLGLKLNSLLRIGLSPITSIANVLFGDMSNIIEAVGGTHFTFGELHSASNIFFRQVSYTNSDKNSVMHNWLVKLNPLQELADYDLGENLTADKKKISSEKILEKMYIMQKRGELYLQSRTMIAMLIHEGYMNADGTNTAKGDAITEKQSAELSNKIQKLNSQIHGRYSQREASTLQQMVLFRAAIQFKKWIPAAIEARLGDAKEWDDRLQSASEGRYRSGARNIFMSGSIGNTFSNIFLPIISSQKALEKGNMTAVEIYNMRKNIAELIMIGSILLIAASLKGDDDDERKRRLRDPYIKLQLTLLNRMSQDLLFFYQPTNLTNMAKNTFAISKLMVDVKNLVMNVPHAFYIGDYEIKKGGMKGYNDFWFKNLPSVIPGLAPVGQIEKIVSDEILPELN